MSLIEKLESLQAENVDLKSSYEDTLDTARTELVDFAYFIEMDMDSDDVDMEDWSERAALLESYGDDVRQAIGTAEQISAHFKTAASHARMIAENIEVIGEDEE